MDADSRGLKLGGLLSQGARLLGARLLTFLGIGLVPTAFFCTLLVAMVLGGGDPGPSGRFDPVAMWRGMGVLGRVAFVVGLFVGFPALAFRSYAASMLVTAEWLQGRSLGVVRAYLGVRRKSLRLLWLCLLSGLFTGPLMMVTPFLLMFVLAPGIPVAVLDGTGAQEAITRGWTLARGNRAQPVLITLLCLVAALTVAIVGIRVLAGLPRLPLFFRPPASSVVIGTILLLFQFYFSVLTLACLDLKGQE